MNKSIFSFLDKDDKRLMRILLAAVILLFIITPFKVSAFSDDFNDGDMGGWYLTGSWSATNYHANNDITINAQWTTVNTNATYFRDGATDKYWSIVMNSTYSLADYYSSVQSCFRFSENATTSKSICIAFSHATSPGKLSLIGGSVSSTIVIGNSQVVRITIEDKITVYTVKVYYLNGTLIGGFDVGKGAAVLNPDRISLAVSAYSHSTQPTTLTSRFDNVVAMPNNIRGYVTSNVTGAPISGATVTISSVASAITNIDGYWDAFLLVDGTYSYSIAKDGYTTLVGSRYFSAS